MWYLCYLIIFNAGGACMVGERAEALDRVDEEVLQAGHLRQEGKGGVSSHSLPLPCTHTDTVHTLHALPLTSSSSPVSSHICLTRPIHTLHTHALPLAGSPIISTEAEGGEEGVNVEPDGTEVWKMNRSGSHKQAPLPACLYLVDECHPDLPTNRIYHLDLPLRSTTRISLT